MDPPRICQTNETFLKYQTPVLLKPKEKRVTTVAVFRKEDCEPIIRKERIKDEDDDKEFSLQEVLNAFFPPKHWTDRKGSEWMQQVSCEAPSRKYIERLRDSFRITLKERQARRSGVCAIREQLYSHLLDELIRQEVIESPERGFLMLRIRDEFKLYLLSYLEMYETSVMFTSYKASRYKHEIKDIVETLAAEKAERQELQQSIKQLEEIVNTGEKRYQDYCLILRSHAKKSMDQLKSINTCIRTLASSINQPKKYDTPGKKKIYAP